MDKILNLFYFGDIFRKWVRIIYIDVKSYILNNGYLSDIVHIFRGIRQCCPRSAYLFFLVVEILATNIRHAKNGITVKSKEIKISQLADDTTLLLESGESVKYVKDLLHNFELIAEL